MYTILKQLAKRDRNKNKERMCAFIIDFKIMAIFVKEMGVQIVKKVRNLREHHQSNKNW